MKYFKYGIWVVLVIAIYAVFAAEFKSLQLISLPLDGTHAEKLNDIAKNFSLSYIAGVVFYVFSEFIPFLRKRRYVRTKAVVLVERLRSAIVSFLDEFSGCHEMGDIKQLYYDAFEKEYDNNDVCKLTPDKNLAVKKLLAVMDDVINVFLQQDVYIGEDDHKAILKIKTEQFYEILLGFAQAGSPNTISSNKAQTLIGGLVNTYKALGQLKIANDNG